MYETRREHFQMLVDSGAPPLVGTASGGAPHPGACHAQSGKAKPVGYARE